jgi:hypothetical protein
LQEVAAREDGSDLSKVPLAVKIVAIFKHLLKKKLKFEKITSNYFNNHYIFKL